MPKAYAYPTFPYARSPDQERPRGRPARHPLVVAGSGPVGLALAIDMAQRGCKVVVLTAAATVSDGSRAICWSKRALEILDRLGVGAPMVEKGVTWKVGKVFRGDGLLYAFDLLPEDGHRMPAFVNLQQYYAEAYMLARCAALGVEIRWQHKVESVSARADGVAIEVATPEGPYAVESDWLVACDGARSSVRRSLGLEFVGQVFRDRFLIADVVMQADFPTERRFWFDPTFHAGRSALLHRQPDNVFRIDLQLGWQADPEEERKLERVIPRLKAAFGPDAHFEVEWVSVYTFQCRRIERFRHGRVIFAGDSAHQVSPFGARGANSGLQDADNLAWKLDLVMRGAAPEALLDSYDAERVHAADENIRNSTRSTDFIAPPGEVERAFRDAALALAERHPFARRFVNSGRLSTPAIYRGSPLSTPDAGAFAGAMVPGAPCADAPVALGERAGWLLEQLHGNGFTALHFAEGGVMQADAAALRALAEGPLPVAPLVVAPAGAEACGLPVVGDRAGLAARRYDARPGTTYLVRPDQHVAARLRRPDVGELRRAASRASGIAAGG